MRENMKVVNRSQDLLMIFLEYIHIKLLMQYQNSWFLFSILLVCTDVSGISFGNQLEDW